MVTKILSEESLDKVVELMGSLSNDEEPIIDKEYIQILYSLEEIKPGTKIIKAQSGVQGFKIYQILEGQLENNSYRIISGYCELGLYMRGKDKNKPFLDIFYFEEVSRGGFEKREIEERELFKLLK